MDCISLRMPYRQTGYYSNILLDYLDRSENLKPFFNHPSALQGIQKAIEERKKIPTNRQVLVEELKKQYVLTEKSGAVERNIEALLSENTFTITTAHQPNIFTGPVYFIYKILHAIKLTNHLNASLPSFKFVPVYYIGSEDADLEELGLTYVDGQTVKWETNQTGAVGKMIVDKKFMKLIDLVEGQLAVYPFGNEIINLIKNCYKENVSIQDATFKLVNALFGEYGLVILIPDNAALKRQMIPVFEDDLLNETPSVIVEETAIKLQVAGYKQQANPREINLFYLKDGMRIRIVRIEDKYLTHDSRLTTHELLNELRNHPEYFSPNVILRGLYQETILPNLVYLGGGGEIAYWLQLKDLFEHYKVPFPVLLLRNSFLIVEQKWQEKIGKLEFTIEDFFLPEEQLVNRLVARETENEIKLNGNLSDAERLYESLKKQAEAVDASLGQHVEALKTQSLYRLHELEKKMLRAEKRKFADQQRQIHTIKENLFPENDLQERHDNFMLYYAKWGKEFIEKLYDQSLTLEQEFVIISEG